MDRNYTAVWQFLIINTVVAYVFSVAWNYLTILVVGFVYDLGTPLYQMKYYEWGTVAVAALILLAMNFWIINIARNDQVHFVVLGLMGLYAFSIPVAMVLLGTYSPLLFGLLWGIAQIGTL